MLFNLLRVVLWLVISFFAIINIRKTKIARKKLISLLIAVLCLGLVSVSGMFPIENLFVDFKSPESVFNYTKTGEIDDVIYGENSCMIVYSDRNSSGGHYVIPKSEHYKIPSCFAVKKSYHRFDRNGNFEVYNVSGTQDYYIIGTIITNTSEISVIDSLNRPVKNTAIKMGNDETTTVIIYSYIENFTSDYYWLINGTKTSFIG